MDETDESGPATTKVNIGVQNICKYRKRKRSKKMSPVKVLAKRKYKESLMNKLLKSGCSLTDTPENISIGDLEYTEFSLQFQNKKSHKSSKKFKKNPQKETNTSFSQARNITANNSQSEQRENSIGDLEHAEFSKQFKKKKRRKKSKKFKKNPQKETNTSFSQARNITANNNQSEQHTNNVQTDSTLNTPPPQVNCYSVLTRSKAMKSSGNPNHSQDIQLKSSIKTGHTLTSQTDCYPRLTWSRTALLKHAQLNAVLDISQYNKFKAILKTTSKNQASQSTYIPPLTRSCVFSNSLSQPKQEPEVSREKFLAQAALNYIAGNESSYAPYKNKELARAHARMMWNKFNGCFKGRLRKVVSTNLDLDENVASDARNMDEYHLPLLQRYFPMPCAGTSSSELHPHSSTSHNIILNSVGEQCEVFPESLLVNNETTMSSDQHSSPVMAEEDMAQADRACTLQKPSDETPTTKVDLSSPSSSEDYQIPTAIEEGINTNANNATEQCNFDNHIDGLASDDTLYIYNGGYLYKHCRGEPDIITDPTCQISISNNDRTFESGFDIDRSAAPIDSNPKEIVFWRENTSLYKDIRKHKLRLRAVKRQINKHQISVGKAYKFMANLFPEIEHLDKMMVELISQKNNNGYCTFPPSLKILHPNEMFRHFESTHGCLKALKELYTKTKIQLTTMTTQKNKQSLSCNFDEHLSITSEQLPQLSSDFPFLPSIVPDATPKTKKGKKDKWCKDAPSHVMSENESLHWARLQVLYKEIQSKTKSVRRCITKLGVVKKLIKFESDVGNETLLKNFHRNVAEYHSKLEAEDKESSDFCYTSSRAEQNFKTKIQRSFHVYNLKQVRTAFDKYCQVFLRLINRFGYEHVINS